MFFVPIIQNKMMLALILLCGLLAAQASPAVRHTGRSTDVAYRGQFPYQAHIINDQAEYYGGTLISPQYVLTAAQNNGSGQKWTVYLGAHLIHAATEEGRLVELVYEIIIHDLYNPSSLNHNIALLKFTYPIMYTEFIQPARLPSYSMESLNFGNEIATATGWSVGFEILSNELYFTEETVYTPSDCLSTSIYFSEYVICANSFTSAGICRTDRGGPLVLGHAVNTTHLLIGIASYPYGIGECSIVSNPDIFTRITKYLSWISAKTDIPIEA